MAKKGGVQQLQAEINNDEDFERFLARYPDALLVLDVYSEWCGPCLGVVNALRKIKLELGGDKLQLAICKSDHITKLRRFRLKSEPTWLFLREGKSINLMFGCNVPKLMDLIKNELHNVEVPVSRRAFIEIDDLHPEEKVREQKKTDAKAAIELKERLTREKKRRDYLLYCTNTIMDNLPDVGVSVFGPQVNRDMFKKINEPAEALKMQCKDRRVQYVTKEDFDTVNFACHNPLPEDVIEQLTQQEILLCYWKIGDDAGHSVPYVLNQYVHELTKKVVEPPDDFFPEERVTPPILEPMKIKVEYEVDDDFICPPDEDEPPKEKRPSEKPKVEDELVAEEEVEGEDEGEGPQQDDQQAPPPPAMDMPMGLDIDDDMMSLGEEEEMEPSVVEPPPKKTCTKTIKMPPVWVPNDERTHAALIYVFFRTQTLPFLQPDPPPEPPHVIMAFDTYKKRDLISLAERNKNDIPLYGFFTSDEADDAKFLANSVQKYAQQPQSATDKLVFKVNKRTSHMMLTLATYGATYVSPNPIVGKEEALKFFPESYKTAEQERLEAMEAMKAEQGEKGKEAAVSVPIDTGFEMEEPVDVEAEPAADGAAEATGAEENVAEGEAPEGEGEGEGGEGAEVGEGAEGGEVGEGEAPPTEAPTDAGGEATAE